MARLSFGRLIEAWKGEASDFTPLLAGQLDSLGEAIGVDLTSVGKSEVLTAGGRRIDIVAQVEDGSEFVIENQYGSADYDHLTRGLAYAVARRARGLVVVAEEHRDEFRAVAQYLNDLAELEPERGISVWLVEAKAVRIEGSPWAPLFTAVVEPNQFIATVEQVKQSERPGSLDELYARYDSPEAQSAARSVLERWAAAGHRWWLGPKHVVLQAAGPAVSGIRAVVTIYTDGHVLVPFGAYEGTNSGIPIPMLTTPEFRARANALFGFNGTEKQARTASAWLIPERVDDFTEFCLGVADAYREALLGQSDQRSAPVDGSR
jgi:hypothetical protein